MTNLDSFRSDLAFEQGVSCNPRINADSQFISTDTNQRKDTFKTRQQGLGLAFLVLFQANRSALKRAINDIYGENALSSAVLKKSDESGKKVAFMLLDWLILDYPYKSLVAQALSSDLESVIDKKRKLSVLLAIEHALHSANVRKSKPNETGMPSDQVPDQAVVQSSEINTADLTLRDMKLEMATRGLRLVVELDSHEEAGVAAQKTYPWCFAQSMLAMEMILQEYHECNQKGNSIAPATLVDTLDIISRFNGSRKSGTGHILSLDIIDSFAQTWSIISSALSERSSASSSLAILERSEGYLQMIMEDIPVGRNVAWAVQDIYVTHASKLDLEHLKQQIFSSFDNATEIRMESAELFSRYIMAFHTSLLPELLKLLPDDSHQVTCESYDDHAIVRTTNALCVVQALAEKDFFSKPLPEDDNNTRCLIENSILGLLRDNNVGIKNKARQVVALIDSIIQRLGTELISFDTERHLNSEASMIECILSQRSDGSIGDGFISFIEYLQSHQRSSLRIEGTKLKSPAQLVLNAKKMAGDSLGQDSDDVMTERLLCVLKRLGDSIPGNLWSYIIDRLVMKTYGSPSDQLLIRIWNILASAIASSPEAVNAASASIFHIMQYQGALTEETLEGALESCDEAIDDLRLARLSPLLMLKTIPAHGFTREFRKLRPIEGGESKSISYQMLQALKSRSDNQMEFSIVRTLSKTVMQGIFPESSLEMIFTGLTKSCSENSTQVEQVDLVETRSWLFTLYDWVLSWTISSNSQEQNEHDVSWIYRISVDFFYKIASFKSTANDHEQDLYKLQLGVVDVLSKVLLATAPFYRHASDKQFAAKLMRLSRNTHRLTTANITETTTKELVSGGRVETGGSSDVPHVPKSPADLFISILNDVLDAIISPVLEYKESSIGPALCLVNVFIMSLQRLAPTLDGKASELSASNMEDISASRKLVTSTLMDLLTPPISACVITFLDNMRTMNSKGYTLLIQGNIQILYTGASISATNDDQAVSTPTKQQMMDVAVMGINCSDHAVAVASLKLLAMMSSSKMMSKELLTDNNMMAIRKGILKLRQSNELQFGTSASVTLLLDKMWEVVA
ncbi:hypothetical protein BGX21_008605 [Mortierella sp. AD011]|nr:hypothetical protein BGX21_008605 [Mortierella sp. AD011]